MTIRVDKTDVIAVPPAVRRRAGIKSGDNVDVDFAVSPGVISVSIRRKTPDPECEYTPAQRAVIDARLALADEDAKKGLVHGPFSAVEATRFLRTELKRRAGEANKPRPR